jgi:putative sigma-54 modulation protein
MNVAAGGCPPQAALHLSARDRPARIADLDSKGAARQGSPPELTGVDLVQISISTRHGHISDETQIKIKEKLEKLTRLNDRLTAIEVIVDLEHRDAPNVDLKVSAKHKHDFVAVCRSMELLAAIDDVIVKMEHQLRKHKEKVQDRHRSGTVREQGAPEDFDPINP